MNTTKRKLHIAVLAAVFAASPIAQATTTTITGPTTIAGSSLSSSTDLDFASSGSGSPADLTITNSATPGAAQAGGASMTTSGSINYGQTASNDGLTLTGDGTATGTGTLDYSVTTPTGDTGAPDDVLYLQGNDPLSGSLSMTQNGTSSINVAQDSIYVGEGLSSSGSLTPYAGASSETLQNLDMGNTNAMAGIDIGPDASLTVDNADFTVNSQYQASINLVANPAPGGGAATDSLTINNLTSNGEFGIGMLGNNYDSVDVGSFDVTGTYRGQQAGFGLSAGGTDSQSAVISLGGGTAGEFGIENIVAPLGAPDVSTLTVNMTGSYDITNGFEIYNQTSASQSVLNLNDASIGATDVTIGGEDVNVIGTDTLSGVNDPAVGVPGVTTASGDINIGTGDTLNVSGGYASMGDTIADTGALNVTSGFSANGDGIAVKPGATFNVNGNFSAQYSTLYFFLNPTKSSPIAVDGGNYTLPNDTLIINAASGTYANGSSYPLITTSGGSGSNSYTPGTVDYVYNGSASPTIDGQQPYVESSSKGLYLCIGGTCIAPASSPTPASTPASTPAPAPIPAPVFIPVHIVSAVQEAAPVLADTPTLTVQQARVSAGTLIATGITGGAPRGVWVKGLGGTQSQDGMNGANYGLMAGYGWSVGPDHRDVAGVAFSAGQSGLGTSPEDYAKASDYGLWAYGTYYPTHKVFDHNGWKIAGTIGGGISTNTIASTSLGLPQIAHFGGSFMSAELRAGYWKHDGKWVVSPRVSVGYDQTWSNAFTTQGVSFLDVHANASTTGQFYVEPAVLVGRKFNYRTAAGSHTLFPQLRAGLIENVGPTPSLAISSGQVDGQVQGLAYPHTQGMAELRLDVISHTRYSLGLSGNIAVRQIFGDGASQTEAVAAIKYRW